MKQVLAFIKTQFITDFRQKFALAGIVLYLVSSSFICYKVFGVIKKPTWNALYWIILVLSSISYTFLTFGREFKRKKEFYHQLFHPLEIYFGKFLYNFFFLIVMGGLLFFVLGLFSDFPVDNHALFFLTLFLGCMGMSSSLSFLSALASSADLNSSMLAVLSLPLLLPILLLCIKLSALSLGLIIDTSSMTDIIYLIAINCLIIAVAILLFPYLWKA